MNIEKTEVYIGIEIEIGLNLSFLTRWTEQEDEQGTEQNQGYEADHQACPVEFACFNVNFNSIFTDGHSLFLQSADKFFGAAYEAWFDFLFVVL